MWTKSIDNIWSFLVGFPSPILQNVTLKPLLNSKRHVASPTSLAGPDRVVDRAEASWRLKRFCWLKKTAISLSKNGSFWFFASHNSKSKTRSLRSVASSPERIKTRKTSLKLRRVELVPFTSVHEGGSIGLGTVFQRSLRRSRYGQNGRIMSLRGRNRSWKNTVFWKQEGSSQRVSR